jgi:hypothetical protein
MDATEVFKGFLEDLRTKYPDTAFTEQPTDEIVALFERDYYPAAVQILQKDAAFFSVERPLFGVNLSALEPTDELWKHIQVGALASFFHGDIKKKFGTLLTTAKSLWGASGDDLSRILNDESQLEELYDYIMNTRLAKLCMGIIENLDVDGIEIDSPGQIIEMIRNPEHPVVQKFVRKIQAIMKEKLTRGDLTQQQMVAEIEGIKAKIQGLFGNLFNEALGGRQADVPATVMTSNSPEARRQRMLARLQRKQREKTQS